MKIYTSTSAHKAIRKKVVISCLFLTIAMSINMGNSYYSKDDKFVSIWESGVKCVIFREGCKEGEGVLGGSTANS